MLSKVIDVKPYKTEVYPIIGSDRVFRNAELDEDKFFYCIEYYKKGFC